MSTTLEVVADSPRLVYALRDRESANDEVKIVVSKTIRESDPQLDPVRAFLNQHEFTVLSAEMVRDESLWRNHGWHVTVQLEGDRVSPEITDLFKELSMS